jgi:hypothetical protein
VNRWLGSVLVLVCAGVVAADRAPTPVPSPGAGKPTLTMRSKQAHGGFVEDMDCSACHTVDGWKLSPAAGASGFDHDRTGFPLRGQHARTPCQACHAQTAKRSNSCEGCHRDPHEGRHDAPCVECHTAMAWSDTTTLEQHRRTRMPLTGRHAAIDCSDCHTRQAGRTFSDLPVDCYACHRARFHDPAIHPTHDGSTGDAMFSRDCGLCHRTSAWSPAVIDPTTLPRGLLDPLAGARVARSGRHDPWFVLSSGSHRGAACTSCHVDARRMRQLRCDGCHDTLALRTQHRGATRAAAPAACLRCHPRGVAR